MVRLDTLRLPLLGAFTLLLAALPAAAEPSCLPVHGRFILTVVSGPECLSPVGICATGEYRGSLRGHSEFTGTSLLPTVDTAATNVVILTGDNLIHTPSGDLLTKDAIVFATDGNGEFAEVDTVISGTGDFAGATGRLTATGTFGAAGGEGLFVGEICWP